MCDTKNDTMTMYNLTFIMQKCAKSVGTIVQHFQKSAQKGAESAKRIQDYVNICVIINQWRSFQ